MSLLTVGDTDSGVLCEPEAAEREVVMLKVHDEAIPIAPGITNSIIMVWLVALIIIVVCQLATRKMTLVPSGLQNLVEWLVETHDDFVAARPEAAPSHVVRCVLS